tara:strand:- start:1533 stop:1976 length:444 start_codon:yes stop_codon:yes gene_type:complete
MQEPNKLVMKKSKLKKNKQENKTLSINSSDIYSQYLDFDYNIDEEFKKALPCNNEMKDTVKLLTIIKNNSDIKYNMDEEDMEETDNDTNIPDNETDNIKNEIEDYEDLDKYVLDNKIYYIDNTKGIIYNTKYEIIGNIDDLGDIYIP